MRHLGFEPCRGLLARVDAQTSDLQVKIEELAGTIESKKAYNTGLSKSKQKPTKGDEIALERARKKLLELEEERQEIFNGTHHKLTHYAINEIRARMANQNWSPEAQASLSLPRLAHEGWGEKGVRIMRGLPLVVTQDKRDMDDGDIKKLDNGHGGLQTVQVGRCGLVAYLSFIWDLTSVERVTIDPTVAEAIKSGELPKELLESGGAMPTWLLERLASYIIPSDVIGQYGSIYCAFEFGYVVIPQADADEAWTVVSITKGKPRYALRKSYSIKKMLEESTTPVDAQTDVAA